ncbi:hypothetical protein [Paenibacillus paridis]|uniref:hypothetical protein n=1 Tax=Paenibacillus paridis TaxID=2583376 RepID=UPI00111E762F|nr:hypothetical protein [Paenibacillus paridis]
MSKNGSGSNKKLSKTVAKALTLTIAAATVVPLLPANFTTAEVSQDVSVADTVYIQPTDTASPAIEAAEESPRVDVPTVEIDAPAIVVQTEVTAVDSIQNAVSAEELQVALTAVELALNLTGYHELSPVDQAQVAEVLFSIHSNVAFTDSGVIQQALNKAVAAQRDISVLRDAITAVNTATSAVQMKNALEVPYLGLVMLNYRNLSAEGKLAAADLVLQAVPAEGFLNRTDIQKTFNGAIASVLEAATE